MLNLCEHDSNLDCVDPCLPVSVVDLLCNLFVEHADVGASRKVGAVKVTLADQ